MMELGLGFGICLDASRGERDIVGWCGYGAMCDFIGD